MLEHFEQYLDTAVTRGERWASAGLPQARRLQDAAMALKSGQLRLQASDAAVAGGMAFLEAELEKRDPKVHEPLTSVTWMRDMPIKSGGGWVEFTSNFFVDYQISGPNMYGMQAGQSTSIPIVQGNITKDIYRVFNWENILRVNFIDMQKSQGIGRSLDELYDKGIKLNWNKALDQQVYQGPIPGTTTYPGLINNTNVTAASVATGGSGSTLWSKKTPGEILFDVNTIMVSTWAASQYDVTGMARNILIPAAQYALISSQLVSSAGNVSILTYLLQNNIGRTQGVDLKIFPSRWCAGAGQSSTDRMVAYVADEDKIYMDVTVPIQRVMTVPTVNGGGAYETLYAGQVGVVKFLYYQPAAYGDGI
jgi:hypothetical protein